MKAIFAILIAAVVLCGTAVAGFQTVTFTSDQLGENREVLLYTPPGYNPNLEGGYPTVIMLHGLGMTPSDFDDPQFELALNFAMQTGDLQKMILAFPDGSTPAYWGGSFYVDSELYGRFEKYIVHDVINYLDGEYNTTAQPYARAIAGYSMGGFGAAHIAMKYSQLFNTATFLSGMLSVSNQEFMLADIIAENDPNNNGAPYSFDPNAGLFSYMAFSMAAALSPNLDNTPPVDFPIDENGDMVQTVWDLWLTFSPDERAATVRDEFDDLDIYFNVGTADEFGFFMGNNVFALALDNAGIDYTYEEFAGQTHLLTDERMIAAIDFIDQSFLAATQSPAYLIALPDMDIVPANGGELTFTVNLISNLPQDMNGLHFWANVILPNGSTYPQRLLGTQFNLPAGANLSADLTVDVPANAPAGEYTLITNVGVNPNNAAASDFFHWTKSGQAVTGDLAGSWPTISSGFFGTATFATATDGEAAAVSTGLPSSFSLSPAYPNPFNPSTTLSVNLPDAADLTVAVYNVTGQQVATLAQDSFNAGSHTLTFDASELSAGVYFVRANANTWSATQKVLLVK
ncbi:T9SS type A sorting domain-containing protein [bacterium]|nr:T9SS type A sorting domain-containing protein [bacterium]